MIIYKCTNLCNGKIYIGKTIGSLINRRRMHLQFVKRGSATYLHSSIQKYGVDNFKWEVIDYALSDEILLELEKHYIRKFNCMAPNGMNLTSGGDGMSGYRQSAETRRKISDAKMGEKNPFWGRRHSIETRKLLSEHHKGMNVGRHLSNETKRKLSEFHRGRKHSEESKRKMSLSRTGTKRNLETKRKMSLALMGNQRWLGKKHTEESLEKMSEARRLYWENWRAKKQAG